MEEHSRGEAGEVQRRGECGRGRRLNRRGLGNVKSQRKSRWLFHSSRSVELRGSRRFLGRNFGGRRPDVCRENRRRLTRITLRDDDSERLVRDF
jgi:hypothetical protein